MAAMKQRCRETRGFQIPRKASKRLPAIQGAVRHCLAARSPAKFSNVGNLDGKQRKAAAPVDQYICWQRESSGAYNAATLPPDPNPAFDMQAHSNLEGSEQIMHVKRMAVAGFLAALAMFLIYPQAARAAEDGGAIFKAKCAACHGADAAGKPAVKAPSLVSAEAKKLTDDELTDAIANGGKEKKASHAFSKKGVTPEQVKALITYIRELQKK
jgi:mono/diheme cytochrome c family protein